MIPHPPAGRREFPIFSREINTNLGPDRTLVEKDNRTYTKFTGLERLPSTNPALSLDQCPLELEPRQRPEVAIAVPYACPLAAGQNPSVHKWKIYVRTFMPQIDGFGMSDPARYQV